MEVLAAIAGICLLIWIFADSGGSAKKKYKRGELLIAIDDASAGKFCVYRVCNDGEMRVLYRGSYIDCEQYIRDHTE